MYILAALPEPLVPVYLQSECLEAGDRDTGYAILEGVEGVHTNVSVSRLAGCMAHALDLDWPYERGAPVFA